MKKKIEEKKLCSFCRKVSSTDYICLDWAYDYPRMCHKCYKATLLKRDKMDLDIMKKHRGKSWIIKNL